MFGTRDMPQKNMQQSELRQTFLDLCLNGEADPSEVESFIEAYNQIEANDKPPLSECLGLNDQEYKIFEQDHQTLAGIVSNRRRLRFWKVVHDCLTEFHNIGPETAWQMIVESLCQTHDGPMYDPVYAGDPFEMANEAVFHLRGKFSQIDRDDPETKRRIGQLQRTVNQVLMQHPSSSYGPTKVKNPVRPLVLAGKLVKDIEEHLKATGQMPQSREEVLSRRDDWASVFDFDRDNHAKALYRPRGKNSIWLIRRKIDGSVVLSHDEKQKVDDLLETLKAQEDYRKSERFKLEQSNMNQIQQRITIFREAVAGWTTQTEVDYVVLVREIVAKMPFNMQIETLRSLIADERPLKYSLQDKGLMQYIQMPSPTKAIDKDKNKIAVNPVNVANNIDVSVAAETPQGITYASVTGDGVELNQQSRRRSNRAIFRATDQG